jgi:hypothetical protein
MIIAVAEDGRVWIHEKESDARQQWPPLDVDSRVVVFYDADGTWLQPVFTTPNRKRWFGLVSVPGEYQLVRNPNRPGDIDDIALALSETIYLEPNPHFASLDALRRHVLKT